ncbi:hypothetical protein [Streptomyces daliensis]|uniref:Uncharacterized protein n=1 Tax=Streptomyces daliensis TaxID=299421 RepID=A0A8T4IW47_9ACTN|nr:hypothetical protein [Streptomyces daliensis]
MSRTDKTKPLWVRYAEHGPRPVHDHRHGACDLPPYLAPPDELTGTRCHWADPGQLLFGHTCCAGCQARRCRKEWQGMVRSSNRKARYEGRREARRYRTGEYAD